MSLDSDRSEARALVRAVAELKVGADRVAHWEASVGAQVSSLRQHGASWSVIGDALGITKQAAQQRFGGTR